MKVKESVSEDVIGLVDSAGIQVVIYRYNSWCKVVDVTDTTAEHIGEKNPFRYRGYYFDVETGWYYLNSRYYDPEVCRFVNADDPALLLNGAVGLSDKNLYVYCDNNPIMRIDDAGDFWNIAAGAVIGAAISAGMELAAQVLESKGKKIKWESVAVAAVGGAVSGGLAASGVGVVGQKIGGAIVGGVSEAYSQWRAGSGFLKAAVNTVVATGLGAYGGALGGKGARHKTKRYGEAIAKTKSVTKKAAKKAGNVRKYYAPRHTVRKMKKTVTKKISKDFFRATRIVFTFNRIRQWTIGR